MKCWTTSKRQRNGIRLIAVALMVLLWVAMCALEVSPDLHHLLHKDAQNPAHNCLVTQLQHHLLLSVVVATVVPVLPDISWIRLSCGDFQFLSSYDYRLPPSRAPPSV